MISLELRVVELQQKFKDVFLDNVNPIELSNYMIMSLTHPPYNLDYTQASKLFFREKGEKVYELGELVELDIKDVIQTYVNVPYNNTFHTFEYQYAQHLGNQGIVRYYNSKEEGYTLGHTTIEQLLNEVER